MDKKINKQRKNETTIKRRYGIKNIVTFDKEFKRVEGFNFIGI